MRSGSVGMLVYCTMRSFVVALVSCHCTQSLRVPIAAVNSELNLSTLVVVLGVSCGSLFPRLVSPPVQLSVVVYLLLCKDRKKRSERVLSVGLMPLRVVNRPWTWSMTLV